MKNESKIEFTIFKHVFDRCGCCYHHCRESHCMAIMPCTVVRCCYLLWFDISIRLTFRWSIAAAAMIIIIFFYLPQHKRLPPNPSPVHLTEEHARAPHAWLCKHTHADRHIWIDCLFFPFPIYICISSFGDEFGHCLHRLQVGDLTSHQCLCLHCTCAIHSNYYYMSTKNNETEREEKNNLNGLNGMKRHEVYVPTRCACRECRLIVVVSIFLFILWESSLENTHVCEKNVQLRWINERFICWDNILSVVISLPLTIVFIQVSNNSICGWFA